MPTGYTAAIEDGRITKLRDFALLCTRAMGVAITMRDDPFDGVSPEAGQVAITHAYHAKAKANAHDQAALTQLNLAVEAARKAQQ